MGYLATTYRNQGRLNEAEQLEHEVMNIFFLKKEETECNCNMFSISNSIFSRNLITDICIIMAFSNKKKVFDVF